MYKSLKMIILFDDHTAFGGRYSNEIIKIIPLRGKNGIKCYILQIEHGKSLTDLIRDHHCVQEDHVDTTYKGLMK